MPLKPNIKAPIFTAPNEHGVKISLRDFKGKNVVLYFYPEDDTETCTKQACEFRDNMERLTAENSVVIGVSPDDEYSHTKFKAKYNLNFHLVADAEKKLCLKYDVWKLKKMFGHEYMGVVRTTYLIDAKGMLRHVFENVRIRGHVDAIIKQLNLM
jgi:peroxiredoxin Q/BCP